MKRPKGVEKTAVWVAKVEWAGLGKCDPLGARFRRNLDAFWTPGGHLQVKERRLSIAFYYSIFAMGVII